MSTPPLLIRNYLRPAGACTALLIVHEGRVHEAVPGLAYMATGFAEDRKGGYIGAACAVNGKYGYVNEAGTWVVPPTLQEARHFSADGVARFCVDGKWGYLDLDGAVLIAPRFDDAQAMVNGLAPVKDSEQWHYIDSSGVRAFDQVFARADAFSSAGLAVASMGLSKGLGYIDRSGNWAIAARFSRASAFSPKGAASVSIDGEHDGLIDVNGDWIRAPSNLRIRDFNADGLAHFTETGTGWQAGYFDSEGRQVIVTNQTLSRQMRCGFALHQCEQFIGAHGKLYPSALITWASDFTAAGYAVVKGQAGPDSDDGRMSTRWGLLDTDGMFHPSPNGAVEPLTASDGTLEEPEPGTPLAPFAGSDGGLVLLNLEGELAYRITPEAEGALESAVLRDALGRELWRSAPSAALARVPRFFDHEGDAFFEGIGGVEEIDGLVEEMLTGTESRLHALAAGESADEGGKENADDEDEDADEEGGPLSIAATRVQTSRRIYRDYLDEGVVGAYAFLTQERGDLQSRIIRRCIASLTGKFGEPDRDPDYVGATDDALAWPVALRDPISTAGAGHLWVSLTSTSDTGDGDAWFEIALVCAPSIETLETAMLACDESTADGDSGEPDDIKPVQDDVDLPQSYDEWLACVCDTPERIADVPPHLIDEQMADAAVEAQRSAYTSLPARFQTPARLAAIIRSGPRDASLLSPVSMTADGLALARALHGDNSEWHRHDQRCSRLPSKPYNRNSLDGVWGCLIDSRLAREALAAGASLHAIPRWLRSDDLEQFALEKDVLNIVYIDPDKITPGLADRAIQNPYAELLDYVPGPLRTASLCMAAVQVDGCALISVPAPLRSADLCVAAVHQNPEAFAFVPDGLEEEVCTRLIDDELSRHRRKSGKSSTRWHGLRAWSRLWDGRYQDAIDDAGLAMQHLNEPAHAHYIRARAFHALGRGHEAAVEAAAALALERSYETEFGEQQRGAWLSRIAHAAMVNADAATLLAELEDNPASLSQIPHTRISAEMVDAALEADPDTVRFVPKRLMTSTLYAIAIETGCKQVWQVPLHLWDEALVKAVAEHRPYDMRFIPAEHRTLAMYRAALNANRDAIVHVPQALRAQLEQE